MYPYLAAPISSNSTAARPSENSPGPLNWAGMTTRPEVSTYPHFTLVRKGAIPSLELQAPSNFGLTTIAPDWLINPQRPLSRIRNISFDSCFCHLKARVGLKTAINMRQKTNLIISDRLRFVRLSCSPPDFKRERRGADNRQRVIRRVNVLGQSEDHFHRGHQERDQTLRPLRFHRGPRIGDHKEDEELIHRPGDRRNFGLEAVVSDQTSQRGESDERDHISRRDVKPLHAPGDE